MPEKEQKQVDRLRRMIATNISESLLANIGETQHKPTYKHLKKIADVLKVTVDELKEAIKHGGKSSSYRKKPRSPRFGK